MIITITHLPKVLSVRALGMVDFTNLNSLAASLLVETFVSLGLNQAVICPGSRSSPLTIALARHRQVDCVVSLDERSASFFALGYGKRTGKPAILVCTSGTAAANFLPAIIEAHYSQIPLLVLTGDRPPRLRHCHAGQTIDQTKLYGHYPQWQAELALPEANFNYCGYLRQTALHAWQKCFWPRLGVVHLNCPLEEPLAPVEDNSVEGLKEQFDSDRFYANLRTFNQWPQDVALVGKIDNFPPDFTKLSLIVVGFIPGGETPEFLKAILAIAKALQCPILCDALCSLRNYADGETVIISNYDFLLRCPGWEEELRPKQVLQIGELPTSKELRNWFSKIDVIRYCLGFNGENLDPLHGQTIPLFCTVSQLANYLEKQSLPINSPQSTYTDNWQSKQKESQKLLQFILSQSPWSAPLVISQLPELFAPQTNLLVANSLPIRWLEFFWPLNGHHHQIFVNRGANGIDGTLSTAMGIAHRSPKPTVLLTGDLSLLHDSNGFLNQGQLQGQLTIILLNNNGGGIFEILPIANFDDVFEKYFATPQTINFAQLCLTYGVNHQIVENIWELKSALAEPSPTPIQVLEIIGDRRQEAQWLKSLQARFSQADDLV